MKLNARLPSTPSSFLSTRSTRQALQRQGWQWKPPPHWQFQEIEYRGFMLATLALVPLIRYTQDTPEDKNALLARDVAALGSATFLYLFMQQVLSNGVHQLGQAHVQDKLPRVLKGLAQAIGADRDKDPHKNKFYSYIPAQVISLFTSAFIGPAIGNQALQHFKSVQHWWNSPDKVQHLKESWQSQEPQAKKKQQLEMGVSLLSLLATIPLAYHLIHHARTPMKQVASATEKNFNQGIRFLDYDLPALMSSLLVSIGVAKGVGYLAFGDTTNTPKDQKTQVQDTQEKKSFLDGMKDTLFLAQKDENGQVSFKLKAPAVGMTLLAGTYMTGILGALFYSVKHHNNPQKLEALYNYETGYHALHWLLPSLILPNIRYQKDNREHRDEFYIRDFTHTWLGLMAYWFAKGSAKQIIQQFNLVGMPELKHLSESAKAKVNPKQIQEDATKLMAAMVALTAQMATQGFLAPRFSHDFVHYLNTPKQNKSERDRYAPPLSRVGKKA